ncbi:TPA: hypothetical protein ACG1OW_003486 [Escherichia coli]|jgi:hypothetical protein|uniref:hypothetical protein n=1 Tax=Escherichia coli TaxID=562 RepID=UPI0005A6E045|nr:hypothetical protein [Escherichia coli]EFJ8036516.1 hypothetical protein [Escherichia coli]MBB0418240.1 hypothetical protein [Escherichia coli]MBW5296414.1 hypothetical protein [Escherichia coli]MCV1958361.1 hypothetical protein [Escherichia coli]MCW7093424.1 hypothetical protein [Escherichia coli]
MESNIKGLVAAGHEMASELKAECGAVDMRSVAKLISDLATQLEVQLVRANALAAENAGLKSGAMDEIKVINRGGQAYCVKDGVQVNPMYARGWNDYRAKSLQSDTPATDAFLAEIERKAIRKFINSIEHILRDKLSPYDTEEMLEAMRIFLEEQGGEQK